MDTLACPLCAQKGHKTVGDIVNFLRATENFCLQINAKQVYLAGALVLSFKSGSLKTNRLAHEIFFNVSFFSRHDSLD